VKRTILPVHFGSIAVLTTRRIRPRGDARADTQYPQNRHSLCEGAALALWALLGRDRHEYYARVALIRWGDRSEPEAVRGLGVADPRKASQRALPSARGIEPIDGIAVDPLGELRDERACVGGIGRIGGPEHDE
jgi:hypothetical protein